MTQHELDPLTGDPIPISTADRAQSPANGPSSIELAALDAMGRDELLALCKRLACQCGVVAGMSKHERQQAVIDRCYAQALDRSNMRWLEAAREALDREQGKATQRIEQKIQNVGSNGAGDLTNDQLYAMIASMKQLPDGVKLLPDGKLDVVDAEYSEVKD